MFLRVIELALIVLVFWAVVTQVVLPYWRNQKLFPIIRKQWKLEHDLEDAQQDVSDHNLKKVIEKTRKSIPKEEK